MVECPGLDLSLDENRLLASIVTVAEHPLIDAILMRALLADAGYAQWAFSDEALDQVVAAYNANTESQGIQIAERRDASFSLEFSPDAMQVWLTLNPSFAGQAANPDDVFLALGEAGVTFGIDPVAVNSVCASNVADRVLVAVGIPSIHGENSSFDLLVTDARDRSPQVNDQGLIDFRDLGFIPTAETDQPLMRRNPATLGCVGRNVRGEELVSEPGINFPFSDQLMGAYVDKEDGNLLRAVFSGQPVCYEDGVSIEHVLRLRNVNLATGNIAFDGTVHIEGEVLPGMKVNATGDILVDDVVDGATLEAGGDIRVSGGIIAKSSVTAAGSVTVRFIENARVYAGTTIAIEDTALQGDLQANNQILVGLKNLNGKLAGGSARAMLLIKTPILGSPTGSVTSLLLGVNPVLDAQYHEVLEQIAKRKEEEDKLEKLVKHLTKLGDKSGMLERASASWQEVVKAWGKLMPEREALEKQLALVAEAKVVVGQSVAGAVDVTFGKKVLRSRQSHGAGEFVVIGDKVEFIDPSGNSISTG
jgi:uncharacterized protein (DUF342 family)